jgi:26S proteasome regulatory subunit N11
MRNMIEKTHHLVTCPYVWLPLYLLQEMLELAVKYNKAVQEEDQLSPEKLAIANVGRQDAKKHLEEHVSDLMSSNIVQTLGTMLDTVVF